MLARNVALGVVCSALATIFVSPGFAGDNAWTGPYIGASVGSVFGSSLYMNDPTFSPYQQWGAAVGLSGGYNDAFDQFVVGIRGAVLLGGEGRSESSTETSGGVYGGGPSTVMTFHTASEFTKNWSLGTDALIGYPLGDYMPYVFVGGTVANYTIDDSTDVTYSGGSGGPIKITPVSPTHIHQKSDAIHFGVSAGVGVEHKLSAKLSGFIEAQHTQYGESAYWLSGANLYFAREATTVRVGLNYHF